MSARTEPIAGTDVFRLFTSPVWTSTLAPASRDAIGAAIDAIVSSLAQGDAAANNNPRWQSGNGLHRVDTMAPLIELFVERGREALARYHVQHGPLEVVHGSAEMMQPGTDLSFSTVPNAYLAGVYAAGACDDICSLQFEDPRLQAHVLSPARTSTDTPDAALASIPLSAGTLAVFPAYLRHRVLPTGGESRHLVVKLGLMFAAFAETMSSPKWQATLR